MERLTNQLEARFHADLVSALSAQGVDLVRTQSHVRVPQRKRRATVGALRRLGWRPAGSTFRGKVYARADGSWPVSMEKSNGNLVVMASTMVLPRQLEELRIKSQWNINSEGVMTLTLTRTSTIESKSDRLIATARKVNALVWQDRYVVQDHEFSVFYYADNICITVWPPTRARQ